MSTFSDWTKKSTVTPSVKKKRRTSVPRPGGTTEKTAYQKNLFTPANPNPEKWYKGEFPTILEICGRMMTLEQNGETEKMQGLKNQFLADRQDINSPLYSAYSRPTNRATDYLRQRGYDVDSMTSEWFKTNRDWENYLTPNTYTNTPKAPGKKSTQQEIDAYYIYQYRKGQDLTEQADMELEALKQDLGYRANRADRNYSDDQLIADTDWKKYPTLAKIRENGAGKDGLLELNKGFNCSDDDLRGMIWASRNDGGTGYAMKDMAMYATGQGNQWQDNPELTAKIDRKGTGDGYSIYSVGMTLPDEVGAYYGKYSFTREDVDELWQNVDLNDTTDYKMFQQVEAAVKRREDAQAEKDAVDALVDKWIAKGYSEKTIQKKLDEIYNDEDPDLKVPTLKKIDETLDNRHLKPIELGEAFDYSRRDLDASIHERVEAKKAEKDAVGVTEDVASSPVPETEEKAPAPEPEPEQPEPTVQAEAVETPQAETEAQPEAKEPEKKEKPEPTVETTQQPVVGQEPAKQTPSPFDETEKANEHKVKEDYEAVAPVIDEQGTEAEKTAFMSGATALFNKGVEFLVNLKADFTKGLENSVNNMLRGEYMETLRTVYDYDTCQKDRADYQAELEEVDKEYQGLYGRYRRMKAFSDMDPYEYQGFMAFVENPGDETWDYFRSVLEKGNRNLDQYQQEEYDRALRYVYERVRPGDYTSDSDVISARGEEWWELYQKMSEGSPLDRLVDEANEKNDDVDEFDTEIELPRDGRYIGEDDDTALNVTLERDDSGRFVFAGAVGNNTGTVYSKAEAEDLLGYTRYDSSTGMTEEEIDRMNILGEKKKELTGKITEADRYLSANADMYADAKRDRNMIMTAALAMNNVSELAGGKSYQDLLLNIDTLFTLAQTSPDMSTQYLPYSYYDMYAQDGQITKEEAAKYSADYAVQSVGVIETMDASLEQLKAAGIELTDDERKNLQANRDALDHDARSFGYASLNASEDFDEKAKAGKKKAESGESGRIAKAVATGKLDYSGNQILGMFGGISGASQGIQEKGIAEEMLRSMSEDEKNRFFYLLEKDGEKAAEDYFAFLTDPNRGELTIRTSADVSERMTEFASENALNAALSTAVSFVGKRFGNAEATVARIGAKITGQELSGYNPAFWMSNASQAERQGAKKYLKKLFGENNITDRVFDILTGLGDIFITSKEAKALGTIFEGSKFLSGIGKAVETVNKLPGGQFLVSTVKDAGSVIGLSLEASNNTYQQVFSQTKDSDKAEQMSGIAMVMDLVSHTVIMKGLHRTFNADPSAFSSKLSALMYQAGTNAGVAGASTVFTEGFRQQAEKIIMKDMSSWGQIYSKYQKLHYPDSMCEQLADAEVWQKIWSDAIDSGINAAIRTGVTFGINEVKNSETVQRAFNKMDVAWKYLKMSAEDISAKLHGYEGVLRPDEMEYTTIGDMRRAVGPDGEDISAKYKNVPDEAVENPLVDTGLKTEYGEDVAVIHDRSTGKTHKIVAFMMSDEYGVVLIDEQGNQIPWTNVATQTANGKTFVPDNLTDYEKAVLSFSYEYGKKNFQPKEPATGQQEPTSTASSAPEKPQEPVSSQINWGVERLPDGGTKDLSIVNSIRDSSPTGAATGTAAILNTGDQNADRAAAQELVTIANGDTRTLAAAMQAMVLNTPNPTTLGADLVTASLVKGSGNQALTNIINKISNGEVITKEDIDLLHNGAEQDRAADPDGNAVGLAIKENRIANRTNEIIAGQRKVIETAEQKQADAQSSLDIAKKNQAAHEGEREAAAQAVSTAVAGMMEDPSEDDHNGEVQQAVGHLLGKDDQVINQDAAAVAAAQQRRDAAKQEADRATSEIVSNARQQAKEEVETEIQQEQQAAAEQQAAEQAKAEELRLLNEQEAAAEAEKRAGYENQAREILKKRGLSEKSIEANVKKLADKLEQKERGTIDTNQKLISLDDGGTFIREMSRRLGTTVTYVDMGDPKVIRGSISDGKNIYLNANMTTGQARVEAFFHEAEHAMQKCSGWDGYARSVISTLYGGEDTDAFRQAVQDKIEDYGSMGITLDEKAAKQEIVADYGRLHFGDEDFMRDVISRGMGKDYKKVLLKATEDLKGYRFKGPARRAVDKIKRTRQRFIALANEAERMKAESMDNHTGEQQFSVSSVGKAVGLTILPSENGTYEYQLLNANGDKVAPGSFTADDVKGTPAGRLIDMRGETLKKQLSNGEINQEQFDKQMAAYEKAAPQMRKFIADIVNMIGEAQDGELVWEMAGSLAFSTLKSNGDKQYGTSIDMGSICIKTKDIINVASELQLKLGRPITKEEFDGIVYEETGKGYVDENGVRHYGVTPCPPCYVFSRWVTRPKRLGMIQTYQNECKDWTSEEINAFMNSPSPIADTKKEEKELAAAHQSKKLWISLCLADKQTDPKTKETKWVRKENPDICPDDILLDFRRTGDMAVQHPGTWLFMQKGGAGLGKAISPYADSRLGESIVGIHKEGKQENELLADQQNAGKEGYKQQFYNPFEFKNEGDEKKAAETYESALKKTRAQNLKGGQRWQSWSDFRAEWGSDYLMEMFTMQMLGATVQTYTKVPQALDLFGSAGFEVNMSLMPHGDGFEHNEDGSVKTDENGKPVLKFSKVTGIDPEAAAAAAKKFGEKGNVQPMIVGISDAHIEAALDSDFVGYVIPFHGSGGDVKRLQHLMSLVGEEADTGFDYQNIQEEGIEKPITIGDGKKEKKVNGNKMWLLRKAIITGEYDDLDEEQKRIIDENEFLSKLYRERYLEEDSDAYHVFFSDEDADKIYPYEYWDTSTTLANADVNSERYIQYCQMMGVIPKFSGAIRAKDKVKYGNFSGKETDENGNTTYTPVKGYWKLLIDRPMYNRVYDENGNLVREKCTYHKPSVVDVSNIDVGAVPMAVNESADQSSERSRIIADRIHGMITNNPKQASAYYPTMQSSEEVKTEEEIPAQKQQAMAIDPEQQFSVGGEMSDSELDDFVGQMDNDAFIDAVDAGDEKKADEILEYAMEHPVSDFGITEELPVQVRDDGLVAVHNLTAERLHKAAQLGGFAGPSSAIMPAGEEWKNFNSKKDPKESVTIFFKKETVDPKADPYNFAFTGDAYTPMFSRSSPDYPTMDDAMKELYSQPLRDMSGTDSVELAQDYRMVSDIEEARKAIYRYQKMTSMDVDKLKKALTKTRDDALNAIEERLSKKLIMSPSERKIVKNFQGSAFKEQADKALFQIMEEVKSTEEFEQRTMSEREMKKLITDRLNDVLMANGIRSVGNFGDDVIISIMDYVRLGRDFPSKWMESKALRPVDGGGVACGLIAKNADQSVTDDLLAMGVPKDRIYTFDDTVGPYDPGGYYDVMKSIPKTVPDASFSVGGEMSEQELLSLMAEEGLVSYDELPAAMNPGLIETDGEGTRQRQFGSQTAQEGDALHQEVKDYLFRNSSYTPETDDQHISSAIDWVRGFSSESDPDGYHRAVNEVTGDDFDYRSAEGQARMLAVMGMAALKAENGDERAIEDEVRIADAFNKQGTDIGRMLQARKLFRLMTPVGRKKVLTDWVDRINNNLADKGKTYTVALPPEILDAAANAKNESEMEDVQRKAAQILNQQLPVTWGERIVAWRMLSMLSAPKTHLRNIIGNSLFVPVVGLKNKVGATMELGGQLIGKISKDERTKTIGWANPEARKFAKEMVPKMEDILRGNQKYKEGDLLQQERKIFGTKDDPISKTFGKALQWWYEKNGRALEREDWWFLRGHYERALSGFMTARGLKPEDMKGETLEEANLYAIKEAQKATYRDDSAVANWMNKIRVKGNTEDNQKGLAFVQWLLNANLPFKRTPINIGKRGVEYSAIGLGKSLTLDAKRLKQYKDWLSGKLKKKPKSAISPTEWIDRFASGLTGTGIMMAGVVAAAYGIARAGFSKDDPEDQIAKLAGEQEYSIHPGMTAAGKLIKGAVETVGKVFDPEFEFSVLDEDVSMTLDWAAPVCLPFFMGVSLQEQLQKGGLSLGSILDIGGSITDPMLNMTLLESVQNMLKTNSYSKRDSLWQLLEKTGLNYVSSLVPTWLGQAANTIDGTRKTTYAEKPENGGSGDKDLDETIQRIRNKIPWVSMSGIPYTNDLGEESEHVIAPWIENLVSAAYFSKVDVSDEMLELAKVYKSTKNKSVLPSVPERSFKVNKTDINLTGEQYTKLKKDHGAIWRETVQSLVNNPLYMNASDDSKAAMFSLADSYAMQMAKHNFNSGCKVETWADDARRSGNVADAIANKVAEDNKTYYVSDKTKSFADALYSGNKEDVTKFAQELNEANADASTIRKELTAYFKPLYREASENGDETTMEMIRDILTDVGDYFDLDKKITKYTRKKDFDKWAIPDAEEEDIEEDEDETANTEYWLSDREANETGGFTNDSYTGEYGTEADIVDGKLQTNIPNSNLNGKRAEDKNGRLYLYADDDAMQEKIPGQLFYPENKKRFKELYDYTDGELYVNGNIDLNHRKVVHNDDGSISTERSITVGYDDKYYLLPTVIDGKIVSNEEAMRHFEETNEHLGAFDEEDEANEYAELLHDRQDWYYRHVNPQN